MKNRFYTWLERVSPRNIVCIGLIALMLEASLCCIDFQVKTRQAIHDLHSRSVAGESISCDQTWAVGKYYKFAVAGLSDEKRAAIDAEIYEIASIYMAQQEDITSHMRGYGRNAEPDSGPYVDNNGWKADIPSAWTPPVQFGANTYISCPAN